MKSFFHYRSNSHWILALAVLLFGNFAYSQGAIESGDESKETKEKKQEARIVAVMHVTFSGVENKTEDGKVENTIVKAVKEAKQRTIPYSATEEFFASEEGKEFMGCFSISCTAKAGKTFGTTHIVTGDIRKVKEEIKVNLTLVDTKKGGVEKTDRQKIDDAEDLTEAVRQGTLRLFKKDGGPVPVAVLDEKKEEEKKKEKEEQFYKGELTTIGPLEIIPRNDRIGVLAGYRKLGFKHFLHIEPQVDLRFFPDEDTEESKLRLGFCAPLNLELFSGDDSDGDYKMDKFQNAGQPRKEDWDSWRDGFQIIRYIQYGRKEDNLYVNVNRIFASSIGHGIIMKRYIPNLNYFQTHVSATVDAYFDYGGTEFYTNDITKANIVGGLAFIKPASFFSDHWMAKSLSLGITYLTDWDAPTRIYDREAADGSYIYDSKQAQFVGADVELKVFKYPVEKPEVDLKVYFDFTNWIDNGSGIAIGNLGRFNLYTSIRQAFRTRVELRVWQDNYTPSYFDPFYEVMKYKYFSENTPATDKDTSKPIVTKYNEFTGRPDTWDHVGGYFEFSYALLDYVGATVAFDFASGQDTGNFLFHLEVPATEYVQFAGTYYKTNVDTAANVFDPYSDNTMLLGLMRIRPIQLLAFQLGVHKRVVPGIWYFPQLQSVWGLKADIEVSWEF